MLQARGRGRRLLMPRLRLFDSDSWGWLLAVASTVSFSLATPLGKAAVVLDLNPSTLLVYRFAGTVLLMLLSLRLVAPEKIRIDRRGFWWTALAGGANGLGSLSFFWSLTRIDASVATMIFSLNPLLILGLLALGGEQLTRRHLVRTVLGLAGAYLLLGPGVQVDPLGALLAAGCMVGFAIEVVIIQWYLRGYDSRTITLYVLFWMLVVNLLFACYQSAMGTLSWRFADPRSWLLLVVLILVASYFAWWSMFSAITRIGGSQMALLMPIETLLSVTWSITLFDEALRREQLLGGALILGSAVLAAQRMTRVHWRPRWRAWPRR
ncbi:MAG: DMT family transporter [Caldilineaceae bacterium]